MSKAILAPAAVLVIWSLLVLLAMAVRRLSGVRAAATDELRKLPKVGGRGQDLDPILGKAAWASHNYSHLMEQPTLFYATVGILAITGAASPLAVWLAWGYTASRIAHSIWQIAINTIAVRFALFLLSTACLMGLAMMAVLATLG